MRFALPLLAAFAFLTGCTGTPEPAPAPPAPAPADTSQTVRLTPLTGTGLRFDGVYHTNTSNLHYYMRFFERGNVALIAGHETEGERDSISIARFLTENVQSGWHDAHNVPVTLRNDSILFQTMAMNGAILYSGKLDGDTVRFLKESRINGKRAFVAYGFEPDKPSK